MVCLQSDFLGRPLRFPEGKTERCDSVGSIPLGSLTVEFGFPDTSSALICGIASTFCCGEQSAELSSSYMRSASSLNEPHIAYIAAQLLG